MYFLGFRPFALAVSIKVYTPALASAPWGLPENNQFLRPMVNGRMLFSEAYSHMWITGLMPTTKRHPIQAFPVSDAAFYGLVVIKLPDSFLFRKVG